MSIPQIDTSGQRRGCLVLNMSKKIISCSLAYGFQKMMQKIWLLPLANPLEKEMKGLEAEHLLLKVWVSAI